MLIIYIYISMATYLFGSRRALLEMERLIFALRHRDVDDLKVTARSIPGFDLQYIRAAVQANFRRCDKVFGRPIGKFGKVVRKGKPTQTPSGTHAAFLLLDDASDPSGSARSRLVNVRSFDRLRSADLEYVNIKSWIQNLASISSVLVLPKESAFLDSSHQTSVTRRLSEDFRCDVGSSDSGGGTLMFVLELDASIASYGAYVRKCIHALIDERRFGRRRRCSSATELYVVLEIGSNLALRQLDDVIGDCSRGTSRHVITGLDGATENEITSVLLHYEIIT